VLSVIGAFILQLIFGIIFDYWVQVVTSFIFFALYAACFYSTIDYHQEKLAVCNENCKKYLQSAALIDMPTIINLEKAKEDNSSYMYIM
jgi:TATA-binding protein-associated factor Taf7